MIPPLAGAIMIAGLVVALWAFILSLLSRPRGKKPLWAGLGVFEAAIAVQTVLGLVRLAQLQRSIESATFVGYQLATVVIVPAAISWSVTDKSRWGPRVVAIAGLVISVMTLRMNQIWATPA